MEKKKKKEMKGGEKRTETGRSEWQIEKRLRKEYIKEKQKLP